jgi:hypothetical protein
MLQNKHVFLSRCAGGGEIQTIQVYLQATSFVLNPDGHRDVRLFGRLRLVRYLKSSV